MTGTATAPAKATREELQQLHGILCQTFLDYLRDTPRQKIRAAMLTQIRGFLRDNHITKNLTQARDVNNSLEELAGLSIPFLPDAFN